MRVALIGATGYVGMAVCARLVDNGHHVIRLVRTPTATEATNGSVSTVAGDALDGDALEPPTAPVQPLTNKPATRRMATTCLTGPGRHSVAYGSGSVAEEDPTRRGLDV